MTTWEKKSSSDTIAGGLVSNRKTGFKIPFFLIILLAAVFIILSVFIFKNPQPEFDEQISLTVANTHSSGLTSLFLDITKGGSVVFLTITWIILLVYLLFRKKNWLAFWSFAIVATGTTFLFYLKNTIGRARPDILHLENAVGFSFPSGHSFSSFLFFCCCAWLIYHSKLWKTIRISLAILFLSIPWLIGYSRIYLGVHYFTDVVGGFLLATLWLLGFYLLAGWFTEKRNRVSDSK